MELSGRENHARMIFRADNFMAELLQKYNVKKRKNDMAGCQVIFLCFSEQFIQYKNGKVIIGGGYAAPPGISQGGVR